MLINMWYYTISAILFISHDISDPILIIRDPRKHFRKGSVATGLVIVAVVDNTSQIILCVVCYIQFSNQRSSTITLEKKEKFMKA